MPIYKVKSLVAYWGGKVDSYHEQIEHYPSTYNTDTGRVIIELPNGKIRKVNLNLFPDYVLVTEEIEDEATVSESKGTKAPAKSSGKGTSKVPASDRKRRS